mmetsp:Transcript_31158/g.73988  ORF Transcript_31158/g.73988 Transcript_31158/m.73988 type:complete len:102 (+) Transcript_31158:132-437(+)
MPGDVRSHLTSKQQARHLPLSLSLSLSLSHTLSLTLSRALSLSLYLSFSIWSTHASGLCIKVTPTAASQHPYGLPNRTVKQQHETICAQGLRGVATKPNRS